MTTRNVRYDADASCLVGVAAMVGTPHRPWCDHVAGGRCEAPEQPGDVTVHVGAHFDVELDTTRHPGRNAHEAKTLYACVTASDNDRPLIEITSSTSTSGIADLTWLTPAEASEYAMAILRAVAEVTR